MTDRILLDLSEGIATLTLNRPAKLNAIDYALADRLLARLDAAEADPGVAAIILTGAGERAFSAGGDIPEFTRSVAMGGDVALRDFVARGQRLTARIEAFPKPIIVAVNGLAYGGGCEITEAAALSIASDRAVFAKPEIRLGMPPTFGGTQRLPRLAGRKRALELLLTGETFTAERALELGLVNAVVPHDRLLAEARTLAHRIIGHSPLAVAAILRSVQTGLNQPIHNGLDTEARQFGWLIPSHDLSEGLNAWIARRPAVWTGR